MPVRRILILGAGSAGLMAAVTLKRRVPHLEVKVVRSPELGVIGVGEGTTPSFARHFFEYLKLKPQQFHEQVERKIWAKQQLEWETGARRSVTVAEGLAALRKSGVR